VPWASEDWTGLLDPEGAIEPRGVSEDVPGGAAERALRTILLKIPDRRTMKLAVAGECDPSRIGFLETSYGSLTAFPPEVDRPDQARADVVLVVRPSDADGRPDDLFSRAHRHLREGGLCLALLPAAARIGGPIRLRLDGTGPGWHTGIHEVELQYRLAKVGFQGVRIRRMRDLEGSMLLAMAVRRASN
jgi:hypothetical protein